MTGRYQIKQGRLLTWSEGIPQRPTKPQLDPRYMPRRPKPKRGWLWRLFHR